ncbi:MAG: TOBE domain-containing protein, partial [Alphaproteobacteria bacterium]|nr:TOBE domain-containing protein [Alphaproteobacteria bacterium]
DLARGEKYSLGIRPEDLILSESPFDNNLIRGTISLTENLGGEGFVHISLSNGAQIISKDRTSVNKRVGDGVNVIFPNRKIYIFDSNGKTVSGIQS